MANKTCITILENVALAPLTTFNIGGAAHYFSEVHSAEEVIEAVAWARSRSVPFFVLGGGSNVLFADEGFGGLVIRYAGPALFDLIVSNAKDGLGGWENLAGIPGTIGGAVRGNAGAFGSEIKDFIDEVSGLNVATNELRVFASDECDFSYRHSFFKDHPEWVVVNTKVHLTEVNPQESARRIADTIAERERRHLQNVRAAGSFFMNPVAPDHIVAQFESEKNAISRESRVPAGWLIEKAGLKGAIEGGAQASMQHPNYLINATGSATASDVRVLAARIKEAVHAQFDITLQEEAVVL